MNRVMVYLNDGHIVLEYEGGKTGDQRVKAGEARWSAAGGKHTSENVGSGPVEIVEIELKSKPGGESKPVSAALDPVKVDPAHYALIRCCSRTIRCAPYESMSARLRRSRSTSTPSLA
jgi:hypothetical protein